MSLPPGPRLPAAAQTLRWAVRPAAFMERCLRTHGECFTLRLAPLGEVVFVADPAAIRQVFTAPPERMRAGEGNAILRPVVGPGSVLLADGEDHLRKRRLLLPPFHGERLRRQAGRIARAAAREVERWPRGRPFALRPRLQSIALEVIAGTVLGLDDDPRERQLRRLLGRLLDVSAAHPVVALTPWLQRDLGPWSPWARFVRARAETDAAIFALIARRRRDPSAATRDDILSALLEARDDHGRALSDAELRDELVTLLVAGHETTATALAWAFERLLRHPVAWARLAAEAASADGDYIDAVIKETLRVRPVFSIVVRRLAAGMEIAGHPLPAGTVLAPCAYLTHRLPRLYPDPLAFRPERFLGRAPEPYAWIPFGGGTRRCLGASFAVLEMKEVLRTVALTARLQPVDRRPEPIRRRAVTLAPAREVLVVAS